MFTACVVACDLVHDNIEVLFVVMLTRDRQYAEQQIIKDMDPTPRGSNDPWNFSTGLTPSVMDPNSHSFNSFANQMPGYYTPTPGGTNTLFHPQAGDLHTPGILGLGTPLSMPNSDNPLHLGHHHNGMHGFAPQMHNMHQSHFANMNPFQMHHPQTFPPQNFQHQQPMFERMDSQNSDSPMGGINFDVDMHNQQSDMMFNTQQMSNTMAAPPLHTSTEK